VSYHNVVSQTSTWPVRREAKERNREALLTAARELVDERGYAGTSVEAVARRAGLTTGAIYSIFGSKVELLTQVFQVHRPIPSLAEIGRRRRDMAGVLEAYGRYWARRLRSPDARMAVELALELQLAILRDQAVFDEARAAFATGRSQLAEELAAAAEARSESLPVPAEELATSLIAAMQGLSQIALIVDGVPDEAVFGSVARRLLGPT
jgi:AcrR family transcriptional regulator